MGEHKHVWQLGGRGAGARCECGATQTAREVRAIFGYPQLADDGTVIPAVRRVVLDRYETEAGETHDG